MPPQPSGTRGSSQSLLYKPSKPGNPKITLGAHWEWVWAHEALLVYTGSCRRGPQGLGGASQSLLVCTGALPVHAWEHRRALVAGQDPEAELAFAGALLSRDFSNFSAWHHRLRLLAPARGEPGALPPEKLKEELELVQNAVFTDPTDQSAWVYLRCILSRAPPPPRVICLHVDREDATLAVIFSRPVKVNPECPELKATVDGSALAGPWRSAEGRPRPSYTWLCHLPAPPTESPAHLEVTWADSAPRQVTLLPGEAEAWWQEPIVERELFW
uniref:geranylgeranyl transferase type-2 subunit alpha n=1 Tax=Lonchura striata TaxID=40157 RepID=UPI000B4C7BA3|nr:geranylgeranyl transferase type-2 subunit alpha [Lonchura striata domestica]